jgi:hypothetical protein
VPSRAAASAFVTELVAKLIAGVALELESVTNGRPLLSQLVKVNSVGRTEKGIHNMHPFASYLITQCRIDDLQREAVRKLFAWTARTRAEAHGVRWAANGETLRFPTRGDPRGSIG